MKKNNLIWKIIQSADDEYILLSDSDTIKKIKGKNSHDIISVLLSLQESSTLPKFHNKYQIINFEKEYINDIIEWLKQNNFIKSDTNKKTTKINIIGEFGAIGNSYLKNFIDYINPNFDINKIFDLAIEDIFSDFDPKYFTLIIGPLFYNQKIIKTVSKLLVNSKTDFLYTELYQNGILLGPLMNIDKETACLNCLEKRRVFNTSSPNLIIENLTQKEYGKVTNNNVFEIGDFEINKVFIFNEMKNILINSNKNLYNKSIFIDYNKYQNQYFNVQKAPNCSICNDKSIYNPL